MRVFQVGGIYPSYAAKLRKLLPAEPTFAAQLQLFLNDRAGACHILEPAYRADSCVRFTNADDQNLQKAWARENGLPASSAPEEILLAQIEDHRTEVLYNQHPMKFGNAFLSRLPGSVKATVAWRAAPSKGGDFDKHDLFVCNFPTILNAYRNEGLRAAYFTPSHDPAMDAYSKNGDRPIDILFVGGYSRHHKERANVLRNVASLAGRYEVQFCLDRSRLVRIAETPAGWWGPLRRQRRPKEVRHVSRPPVFGRELYDAISRAKIVLNGAVDMAASDRGNMRCWEALGCGALMVSDEGVYPSGMRDGVTMITYSDADEVVTVLERALESESRLSEIAQAGNQMIRQKYSKAVQWSAFKDLVGQIM